MSTIASPSNVYPLPHDDVSISKEQEVSSDSEEAWTGDNEQHIVEDVLNNNSPTMLSKNNYKENIPSMVVSRDASDRVSMATEILSKLDSDDEAIQKSENSSIHRRGKRKKYQKYSPEDRIAIGKYCFEHGPAAARKAFQSRYPEMSESVTRGFRDKYKLMIGETAVYEYEMERRQREADRKIEPLPRGRPRKILAIEDNFALPTMVESKSENSFIKSPPSPSFDRKSEFKLSSNEKMRIGSVYTEHGMAAALKESEQIIDGSNEDLVMQCYHFFMCSLKKSSPRPRIMSMSPPRTTDERSPHSFHEKDENASSPTSNIENGGSPPPSNGFTYPRISMHDLVVPVHKNYENKYFDDHGFKKNEIRQHFSRRISTEETKYRLSEREFMFGRSSISPRFNGKPISPYGSVSHERNSHSPIIHYPKASPVEINNNTIVKNFSHAVPSSHNNHEVKEEFFPKSSFYCNDDSEPLYHKSSYPFDRQPPPSPHQSKQEENAVTSSGEARSKRFKYQKYTPEDRYNIGKLCNEIGLGATVKVYREKFPRLNESVVRTFRNRYRELLEKGNGVPQIEAIERKPSSRRSHSTASIEGEVVNQLHQFRLSNIDITENLAMAVAENILARKDTKEATSIRNSINRAWANSLLWKHKLINKPVGNSQGVCCERCKTLLVCPKC